MAPLKVAMLTCSFALLTACMQQQSKPQVVEVAEDIKVEIQETKQTIPQQRYDQFGNKVPYAAVENPYLLQKGQVSKGSVLLFIEAKKAIKKKDYKTARQKLKVITGNDKTLAGPWVLLADIAKEEKNYEQAIEFYKKAIEINPDNVNAYTALAHAQRLTGDFKQAQNVLAQALQVWPDFPEAHLNLGILYDLYLNQPTLAQQHMEAYLFLSKRPKAEVKEWFEEVKARTGIQTSFIDKGPGELPPVILPVESQEQDGENATEVASEGVAG